MTALSAETRRLLHLSRAGDDPTAASEQAVRNRLIARLGVTALAGVASASVVVGAPGAMVGSAAAKAASVGATAATWAKTVAAVILIAGLEAGVWRNDDIVHHAVEWPATVARQVKQVVKRAWQVVMGDTQAESDGPATIPPPINSELLHERLIAIARRPNHPVAKEAELVLILGAEHALAAGDHERAARYLDQHETRFAGGELRTDREALRALCDRARRPTNF